MVVGLKDSLPGLGALGFRVWGLGLSAWGLALWVVVSSGFRVVGLGFLKGSMEPASGVEGSSKGFGLGV